MRRVTFKRLSIAIVVLILAMGFAYSNLPAGAGPVTGDVQYRLAGIQGESTIFKAPLIEQANNVMPGTTPVNGATVCVPGEANLFVAQLTLGAAPTFAAGAQVTVVLQNSFDGGVTWSNVGSSFAALNATLTPAGGQEKVMLADVAASTAIVWGDCWRTRTTWAGAAGTTTVNFGVQLLAK